LRSATNFGKSELQPRFADRALDFMELPQGNRQHTAVETNRRRKPVVQKIALSAPEQTIWSTLSTDAGQIGAGAHFVAAGQPCTGAPDFKLPSTRLGSHVAARRPINPCHENEAGAFRLCTDRVNFLKTAFLTDQVEESDMPTLTFFFRPSAEDEARQTACRLSALIKPASRAAE